MHSAKGITLIEIIITIFILTVGLVAILQMFPIGTHLAKSGEMATIATQLGQGKIENELSKAYNNIVIGTTTEDYGEIANFEAFKRITIINCVRASDISVVDCEYDPTNDPDPMKKIEVIIYWYSPLGIGEKNINLFSLISKR